MSATKTMDKQYHNQIEAAEPKMLDAIKIHEKLCFQTHNFCIKLDRKATVVCGGRAGSGF